MPAERLPFSSTASPAFSQSRRNVAQADCEGKFRVSHGVAAGRGGVADLRGLVTDGENRVEAAGGGAFADIAMSLGGVRAEFAHAAEHGDLPSAGIQSRERFQSRAHGVGVGVVGIVEKHHAADALQLHAAPGEPDVAQRLGDLRGRHAMVPGAGGGEGGVGHHVFAGNRKVRLRAVASAESQVEAGAGLVALQDAGADIAAADAGGDARGPCCAARWMVRIRRSH